MVNLPVRLALLGGFAVCPEAGRAQLPTRKTEALFAYLALARGRPATREALVQLLWSLHSPEHGRNNLRQALSALRRWLGTDARALATARDTVVLDPEIITTDVAQFERFAMSSHPEGWQAAAALYHGDLLAGFVGLHARGFEEWRLREAARLRALAGVVLLALLSEHEGHAVGSAEAEVVARRLLEIDPRQEAAHRTLMRRYAALGQRALVLEQYRQCRDRLGTPPSFETEHLRYELSVTASPAIAEMAGEALQRPDRPSLAVLPFVTMSDDPEQEYFADGMVEDITTALSRHRWLFVIARNSAFTYKGRAVDVREVGRTLGVHYVLEGSVRRSGQVLRISGQLVETDAGRHIWADRFDGSLEDVFGLQDLVTASVVAVLEPTLRVAEVARAMTRPTGSLGAYELYLRALALYHALSERGTVEALRLLRRASEADPEFARATGLSAMIHAQRFYSWWGDDDLETEVGLRLARNTLQYGQDDPEALRTAGYAVASLGRDHDGAVAALDRALLLGGDTAPLLSTSGSVRCYAGHWQTAREQFQRAVRLSPLDPEMAYILSGLSMAHFIGHQYDDAVEWARQSIRLQPGWSHAHRCLVTSLANAGRLEEARAALPALMASLPPRYSLTSNRRRLVFRDPDYTVRFLDGLRCAGVRE